MFVDRARVRVTGGHGGKGCCSFRREKYVPRGGPDGGDGGKGGDVYFVADERLTSLLDLQYHSHWKAERGAHGQGKTRHGKDGADLLIPVPAGTVVRDFETGDLLADLTQAGRRFLAAHGGRGGKGNAQFATPTRRAPHFAEKGEPPEDKEYLLELKLIAEVGIVGLPNAGKSTLLAAVTAARPKIAQYPFTTLSPNLGVVPLSDYRTFTIADLPGIIEGASEGKGLGHDFLRHIERTKVLLFLIDLSDEDPSATRRTLESELVQYSPEFASRPKVFALNKADVPENRRRFRAVAPAFTEPFLISGLTREGLAPLLEHLWTLVDRLRHEEKKEGEQSSEREYAYEQPFTVTPVRAGFRIEGKAVVRALRMTDFANEEAVQYFHRKLQRMGVFKALQRLGAREGQAIFIDGVELDYRPD